MSEHDVDPDAIHGRMILGILAAAQASGIDMRAVAATAGIDLPALALDPDASVPVDRAVAMWLALEARSANPLVGLAVAAKLPLGLLGFVYHSLNVSDTLRDAVARASRYQRFIAGPLRTTLTEHGDAASVAMSAPGYVERLPFVTQQHLLTISVRALNAALGAPLTLRRATFTWPWSGSTAAFAEVFGAAEIAFAAPTLGYVFARADLDRPVPSADPTLARWLDAQAEQRLEALASRDVVPRIRAAIQLALGRGEPALDDVAQALRVSSRTLQRRLQEVDSSFAAEVDAVRKELALKLLADRARSTSDVAFLAGYSEISAFYRAFRRWTGSTPAEWRRATTPA